MSLLDDVSIVVTPNGYKAGELYAVIPVPTLGAELMNCSSFDCADPAAAYNEGSGWTFSGGKAIYDGTGGTSQLAQSNVIEVGKQYKVIVEVLSNEGSGQNTLYLGGTILSTANLSVGTHVFYGVTNNSSVTVTIYGRNGEVFEIGSISVKELTSADMDVTRATAATRVDENGLVNYAEVVTGSNIITDGDFPNGSTAWALNGWTISDNAANCSGITANLIQTISGSANKTYSLTFTISNYVSGSIIPAFVGVSNYSKVYNANGTFTEVISSYSDTRFVFYAASFDGSVDNVSVKEVTRDNVPRIDYSGCPHILAEPQRTNLVTESEDFSAWTSSNSTLVNSTTVVNPSGESSSGLFSVTSGSATKFSYISVTTTSNLHSYSIFVKYSDVQFIQLAGGGNTSYANFDVQNGVLGNTNANSSIESFGNGWYKCIMTSTSSETFSNAAVVIIDSSTSTRLSSTSEVGSVYIWGGQLEVGSYATSYIPTSGSTVTRNQDIFTRDGIGSLINSTEGTLYFEGSTLENGGGSHRIISLSDGTSNNLIYIRIDSTASRFRGFARGSSGSYTIITVNSIPQTDNNKIALVWDATNFRIWINGSERATTTINNSPVGMNALNLADTSGTADPFYGKVKQLQVFKTALTDPELVTLTT